MQAPVFLSTLVDVAFGTPEVGAVNFSALHSLITAMINCLNIQNVKIKVDLIDTESQSVGLPTKNAKAQIRTKTLSGDDDVGDRARQMEIARFKTMRAPFHCLEKKVDTLTETLQQLNDLPTNEELLGKSMAESTVKFSNRPLSDMWQTLQIKKKMEANEDGINKLMSMIQYLMSEMRHNKERIKKLAGNLEDVETNMSESFSTYVTWPALHDAFSGKNPTQHSPSRGIEKEKSQKRFGSELCVSQSSRSKSLSSLLEKQSIPFSKQDKSKQDKSKQDKSKQDKSKQEPLRQSSDQASQSRKLDQSSDSSQLFDPASESGQSFDTFSESRHSSNVASDSIHPSYVASDSRQSSDTVLESRQSFDSSLGSRKSLDPVLESRKSLVPVVKSKQSLDQSNQISTTICTQTSDTSWASASSYPASAPTHTSDPASAPTHTSDPASAPTHTSDPASAPTHTSDPASAPTHTSDPASAPTHTSDPASAPTHTSDPASAPTHTSDPASAPTHTSDPASAPTHTSDPASAPTHTSDPASAPTHTSHPASVSVQTSDPVLAHTHTSDPASAPTHTSDPASAPTHTSHPASVSVQTSDPVQTDSVSCHTSDQTLTPTYLLEPASASTSRISLATDSFLKIPIDTTNEFENGPTTMIMDMLYTLSKLHDANLEKRIEKLEGLMKNTVDRSYLDEQLNHLLGEFEGVKSDLGTLTGISRKPTKLILPPIAGTGTQKESDTSNMPHPIDKKVNKMYDILVHHGLISKGHGSTSTGHGAISTGHGPISTGHGPISTGHGPISTGDDIISTGHGPMSTGDDIIATGHGPMSTGDDIISTGHSSMSTGDDIIATGHDDEQKKLNIPKKVPFLKGVHLDEFLRVLNDRMSCLENILKKDNPDIEMDFMKRMQDALDQMQKQINKIEYTTKFMIEENNKKLQDLLNNAGVDIGDDALRITGIGVDTESQAKADRILGDVEYRQEDLNRMINDIRNKLAETEDHQKSLASDVSGKLDKVELPLLKKWLEKRLKELLARCNQTERPDDDDAAGLRKRLAMNYHCLSCDRPIDILPTGVHPGIPARRAPHSPFELDLLQHSVKCQPIPSRRTGQPFTTDDMERIQKPDKSFSMTELASCYETIRNAGGPHTSTFLKLISSAGLVPYRLKQYVEVQGADGHIYKGSKKMELEAKLPTPLTESQVGRQTPFSQQAPSSPCHESVPDNTPFSAHPVSRIGSRPQISRGFEPQNSPSRQTSGPENSPSQYRQKSGPHNSPSHQGPGPQKSPSHQGSPPQNEATN